MRKFMLATAAALIIGLAVPAAIMVPGPVLAQGGGGGG
jgi:hypothetical protein